MEIPGTYQNPAKPGGTRRNPAETWRKPGGVAGSIIFGMVYTPNPPPSTYFFSAGFRQVSAGFRRVPRGSAALRRVPLGSAGFQAFASSVPPGCAGFCRVSANKVPAPDSPFNLLLGLCKVLARRLPRLRQSKSKKRFLQMPGHCASQLMEKNTNKIASLVE